MQRILETWLYQQCQMLPGSIHGVLLTGPLDEGPYTQAIYWPDAEHDNEPLKRVAQAALRSKQAVIKTRNSSADETGEPLDAMACPLFLDGKLFGVFALQMSNRSQPMQQAAIRQVQAGVKWLETMVLLQNATSKDQLINLVDLVATGLENEHFRVAATEVANELTTRFSCQRVSFGFIRHNQIRIEAISHTQKIDRQANLTRALREAMNEAVDQSSTVIYPLQNESSALVTRMHAKLAEQQQGSAICTIPLIKNGKAIGALLLERAIDEPFDQETAEQCQQIGLLIGPVLETRRREERPLAAKIYASLHGGLSKLFGAGHLPLKVTVAITTILLLWISLATTMFHVSNDAFLEAGINRAVVAPQQGFIATSEVRAGDLVSKGDVLATLDDRDLLLEQRKWQSQRAQLLKEYRQALAGFDRAEVAIIRAKRVQAEAQLDLVEQQLQRTTLVAPFSGLVTSGDLSQSLGSPVERGEVLYEVAPTDTYRVVIKVDERDISLLTRSQQGQLKLSGLPNQTINIEVNRVTPVSTSEEGHNYFRVEATMENQSDLMRPGMEGVAKIDIGERKLLWILSRRLVEWFRMFTWSRLP